MERYVVKYQLKELHDLFDLSNYTYHAKESEFFAKDDEDAKSKFRKFYENLPDAKLYHLVQIEL